MILYFAVWRLPHWRNRAQLFNNALLKFYANICRALFLDWPVPSLCHLSSLLSRLSVCWFITGYFTFLKSQEWIMHDIIALQQLVHTVLLPQKKIGHFILFLTSTNQRLNAFCFYFYKSQTRPKYFKAKPKDSHFLLEIIKPHQFYWRGFFFYVWMYIECNRHELHTPEVYSLFYFFWGRKLTHEHSTSCYFNPKVWGGWCLLGQRLSASYTLNCNIADCQLQALLCLACVRAFSILYQHGFLNSC